MCVCVCVCVCMYICVCIYDTYTYILRWYIRIYSSSLLTCRTQVTCTMLYARIYHCNKQASNVLLSIQFDTNVSQLLRHVLPWSYDPLPSLGELSSSSLNRLSVCLSCLFCLCIPPVVYGRPILCLLCLRVSLFSKGKKGGGLQFSFFFKMKKKLKKMTWRQAWRDSHHERLTSGVRRQPHPTWRPDVRRDK
jgi:hypothetical protein